MRTLKIALNGLWLIPLYGLYVLHSMDFAYLTNEWCKGWWTGLLLLLFFIGLGLHFVFLIGAILTLKANKLRISHFWLHLLPAFFTSCLIFGVITVPCL
jgi:hypothetical protein